MSSNVEIQMVNAQITIYEKKKYFQILIHSRIDKKVFNFYDLLTQTFPFH